MRCNWCWSCKDSLDTATRLQLGIAGLLATKQCVLLSCRAILLIGKGLHSERSCVSPSQLIAELVDQHGHKLPMGGQEDLGMLR